MRIYILLFSICVLTYSCASPQTLETTQTSSYHKNEKELEKQLTDEHTTLPELTNEETQELETVIKETRMKAQEEVKKQSVEQMRDEVHQILDEIIEEDSTVVISFNMQVPNPLHN